MIDAEVVRRRLGRLQRCLRRLERLTPGLSDDDALDIAERNLQVAIQACIDIASHVLASNGESVPDTYGELFTALSRLGWLPPELASRLRRAVGMRNVLVHDYLDIDPVRLSDSLTHLDDLRAFGQLIQARL